MLEPPARIRRVPLLFAMAIIALSGLLVYPYDLVISRTLSNPDFVGGDVRKLIDLSEAVAHGAGVAVALLLCWCLAVDSRFRLFRIAACAATAGLIANVLKLLIFRRRPLALHADVANIDITWGHMARGIPVSENGFLEFNWQSFPSAHTATAVAFAVGMVMLFPKGRPVFWFLAILAGVQRVVFRAHWPTDVLAGAVLGLAAVYCYYTRGCLGTWIFDRLERGCQIRRLRRSQSDTASKAQMESRTPPQKSAA